MDVTSDSLNPPRNKQELASLSAEIECSARSRDRFRLLKQLQKIASTNQNIAESPTWISWCSRFESSRASVETRRSSVPSIDYPALPVSDRAEEIAALIRNNQVVVIAGETGSGKTTQLPKICLQAGRGVRGLIGHTQPRRIAARSVASRLAEELRSPLGVLVGYQVRFTDQVAPESLIKVMTDGILLNEIQRDPYLGNYDTLIIDEAHERSLNIDFLLGFLKRLLPQRPDLKLIITSATIDLQKFAGFFDDAPIVEVSGRTYPVEIRYRNQLSDEDDRGRELENCISQVLAETRDGDILVFLSGERQIREASQALRKLDLKHAEVIPLYARLSLAEQNRVFAPHGGRRVVLSTNVAETSITVPGIKYVIDTGYSRISRYSFRSKVQRLPIEPISQASANQRAGRCGRLSDGVCYRLYSQQDYDSRAQYTDPEIVRTNLAAVILQLLNLRLGDIRKFPFIDMPDHRLISDGFKLLEELQAVSADGKLTPLGRKIVVLPVDPRFGRMLLEAEKTGALREVLIIVSALSIQDPRERPADKRQAADQAHSQWRDDQSDFIALLNLWKHMEEQRQQLSRNQFEKYCHKNFVSPLRMREWRDLHHQVHSACRALNLRENQQPADYGSIHLAILAGLLTQVGMHYENREYNATRNRKFLIFPGSGIGKKLPRWVMAAELMETEKQYALNVARIEVDWLEPLAAHLVKRHYSEPFYHQKSGQVMARERQTLFGLTIVDGKNVVFGHKDPIQARQVFIQQALVEDGYRGKGRFCAHNRQLVQELEDLEERLRRRDLLAEQEVIFRFYDERVPDGIYNLADFEKWRKQVEKGNPELLFLDRELLLIRTLSSSEVAQFPEQIEWQGICYPLRYRFEPGHAEDGVSVLLQLAQLHQAPAFLFQWLVPGMLRDKCIALIKSLPKQLRRNFVPVPDIVDRILLQMHAQNRPLTEALGEQLLRLGGARIDPLDWRVETLDDWYKMNFVLLDEQGETLAMARDLEQLQRDFRRQVTAGLEKAAGSALTRSGIVAWDFDELPEVVDLPGTGARIKAWPALRDTGDSVSLEVLDNPLQAESVSRAGQLRLALLRGREQVKYLRKHLLKDLDLGLVAAGAGSRDSLVDALATAAFSQCLFAEGTLVRTRAEFQQRYKRGIADVVPNALRRAEIIESLLPDLQEACRRRRELPAFAASTAAAVQSQLEWLFGERTLANETLEQLSQYPRYVQAMKIRLDKAPLQPVVEKERQQQLESLEEPVVREINSDEILPYDITVMLLEYRWALEELRVSFFAQQLKTRYPVSDKRLNRQWREIEDRLKRYRLGSGRG